MTPVEQPLFCQVTACPDVDTTGVSDDGSLCERTCSGTCNVATHIELPCLLPHDRRCVARYPSPHVLQVQKGHVPAHVNVLEAVTELTDTPTLFTNFENLLINLNGKDTDKHQCVWNAIDIRDNDMNPGGVSHTFLPPNKVYARDQLADGSKFCQPWTRDPTVYPYPMLPLQNTVAQVGSSRRILLNTSARVMHYNYDGVGNDNLNVDSIDVLAAPPNRFTGDLFLNVDLVNAHQVSLAVHIPMDLSLIHI